MSNTLTARQQQILHTLHEIIQRTGIPPTRAELAKTLGFRSANAAEDHLRALARKGVVELTAGTSRGIRILDDWLAVATGDSSGNAQKEAVRSDNVTAPPARRTPSPVASSGRQPKASAMAGLVDRLMLPLIGRVAAGQPILAAEHVARQVDVDPGLFTETPDYLLTVRGLSMRDAGILEGDLVAVRKTTEAHPGQIVVARLSDEVTVKRLQRSQQGWELLPENPDFEPIVVGPADDFELEGVVVGLIRPGPRW